MPGAERIAEMAQAPGCVGRPAQSVEILVGGANPGRLVGELLQRAGLSHVQEPVNGTRVGGDGTGHQ